MIEFIIGAVCGIFGFMIILDWAASKHEEFKKVNRGEIGDIVGKVIKENTIMMKVEFDKASKLYFCYDSTTNDYICQGHNLKEIHEAFKLRYPEKLGHILSKYNYLFPKKQWREGKIDQLIEDEYDMAESKDHRYLEALEQVLKEITVEDPSKSKPRAKKKKKKNDT